MTTDTTPVSCALTAGWLDVKAAPSQAATLTTNASAATGTYSGWGQAYYPSITNWWYQPIPFNSRPIKLGMSEVEKLRSAAKRDAKLKAILEKFTDQIEVTVDFK